MVTERSDLVDTLLACLNSISREEEELLLALAGPIRELVSALPAGPGTLRKLLEAAIGCLAPHLLYLPHRAASPFLLLSGSGGSATAAGLEAPLPSQSYINKIHSTDVIGRPSRRVSKNISYTGMLVLPF
jgi:hypothetical protein